MEAEMDWMYKGNQMVNREEYLLGRPVDKAFEQMQQAEKETELNRMPKNHVEYECIPPSLRFFSGNEQVDLVRKMQEDPLYAIKKKEIETRNQLLKNPIKLKQLRELLEEQSSKSKSKKKKSKQKDSSEDEDKLDILLASKYKQLKDNVSEKDLLKSIMKMKDKKQKKSKKQNKDSESESDDDASIKEKRHKRQKRRKKSTSDSDSSDSSSSSSSENDIQHKKRDNKKEYNKEIKDSKNQDRKRKSSKDRNLESERSKRHRREFNADHVRLRYKENDRRRGDSRNRYNDKRYSVEKQSDTRVNDKRRYSVEKQTDTRMNDKRRYSVEKQSDTRASNSGRTSKYPSNTGSKFKEDRREDKYRSKGKSNLTEEEKERRRREMMANAVWRDKEREKNVKQYREEEKREMQNDKTYSKDFIRKQLVVATEVGTVASRIKSNINNIQRSGRAMDTNFAKR